MTTAAPSDVRTWARERGLTSSQRGPLPRSVLQAYAAEHDRPGSAVPARRRPVPTTRAGEPGSLEQRLADVESQLARALARVAELEQSRPRSLFGLRVTL